MLHRGLHRGTSELGRLLIPSTQATSGPPLPLASGPPLPLEEIEIPITWQWYLRHALICLVGWLLVFALLFLLGIYMQDASSLFLEQ